MATYPKSYDSNTSGTSLTNSYLLKLADNASSLVDFAPYIPKYSKLNDVIVSFQWKTSVWGSDGDCCLLIESNGKTSITELSQYAKTVVYNASNSYKSVTIRNGDTLRGTSGDTISDPIRLITWFNSEKANVGEYSGTGRIDLWFSGTVIRKFYWKDLSVTFDYSPPTFNLSVSAGTGGTVSGGGTYEITTPTTTHTATITATPAAGYKFVKWSDGDTNASRSITLNESKLTANVTTLTYTAVFEQEHTHSYTTSLTSEGRRKHTCSCGDSYIERAFDIGYDNLFSFADWAESKSSNSRGTAYGTINYNITNGTITATSTADCADFFSSHGVPDSGYYTLKLEEGVKYILQYDVDNPKNQAFVFYHSSTAVNWESNNAKYNAEVGTWYLEFTVPVGKPYVDFRFGNTAVSTTTTFSNIALYKASEKDKLTSIINRQYRQVFFSGDNISLYTPIRNAYRFLGWYTGENGTESQKTSTSGLSASTAVYSHWVLDKINKILFGTSQPTKIFIDTQEVKAVYIGTTKVYG